MYATFKPDSLNRFTRSWIAFALEAVGRLTLDPSISLMRLIELVSTYLAITSFTCNSVLIDSGLTMDKQVTAICISCSYHIRALRHIRRHLPSDVANIVACSLAGSRLDYCNALLYAISQCNMAKLLSIQNTVSRINMEAPRRTQAVDLLKDLHWLLVKYRVEFKIATFMYKSMNLKEPKYLSELLHQKECSRSRRSADQQLLQVPRSRTEIFTRAFQICAPTIWNNLPLSLRLQPSLSSFKKGLTTHYFNIAYSHWTWSRRLWVVRCTGALQICLLTYLLIVVVTEVAILVVEVVASVVRVVVR